MRDRRNTNVSILPVSSSSSTSIISSPTSSARDSISEDLLELGSKEALLLETGSKIHKSTRTSSATRIYALLSLISIIVFILYNTWHQHCFSFSQTNPFSTAPQQAQLLEPLPQDPAAVTFVDDLGRQRWTVSTPTNNNPLTSSQSEAIYRQAERYEQQTSLHDFLWSDKTSSKVGPYAYMDVDEAQALQILPAATSISPQTCQKSLTFVIDANETSFGKTLLLIWLSYGLAKRDGRAFFLDDSKWAYGSYASLFSHLPDLGCQRPDYNLITPYPLAAKHLVVHPATIEHLLPKISTSTFAWPRSTNINNQQVFELLRAGYEDLFALIDEDAEYAGSRIEELKAKSEAALIGMHIRRGDLRPFERQFSSDYLPTEKYTNAAKAIASKLEKQTTSFILASDDPDLINSPDLIEDALPYNLIKSQERIQLATKAALDKSSPAKSIRQPGTAYVKHVDENAGWDGGFYPALFLALGGAGRGNTDVSASVPAQTMQMRQLIARGYLLDLAVLSKADGVACAVSSASCRLLGVMMGKDAVEDGKWMNADDRRKWSWNGLA